MTTEILDQLVGALNQFGHLSRDDFDRICERFEVNPDDTQLISRLIDHGWVYSLDGHNYIRDDLSSSQMV